MKASVVLSLFLLSRQEPQSLDIMPTPPLSRKTSLIGCYLSRLPSLASTLESRVAMENRFGWQCLVKVANFCARLYRSYVS